MRVIVKNKKGFTLVELLATIAILSILVVFVVPEVYGYLNQGYSSALELQEREVVDAAVLYVEDYCKSPINSQYKLSCNLNTKINASGFIVYYGNIKLSTIISSGYIGNISFRNKSCSEKSYITVNDDGSIEAYLKCLNGDDDDSPYVSKNYSEEEFNAAN